MSPYLEGQITALLEDSRWDIAYLGMQIVIESLALAAFGDMLRRIDEPLLHQVAAVRAVRRGASRRVRRARASRSSTTASPRPSSKERQEFLVENTLSSRARATTPEVWERMGVDVDDVRPHLRAAAGKIGMPQGTLLQGFYTKLVPNVRKLGLLDANDGYLRERGVRSGCSSSSSPTTPDPTTSRTTRSPATVPRRARSGARRSGDRRRRRRRLSHG